VAEIKGWELNANTAKGTGKDLLHRDSRDQLQRAKETRGVARVNAGNGDVLGHNGARADDDMITNRNRENGSICSDTDRIADLGLAPKTPFRCRSTINEAIINKHRPMRNEAVVPNRNQIADKRVGLNPAPLSDGCSLLYLNERPDETAISNRAPIEIDRLYNDDVLAEINIDNP